MTIKITYCQDCPGNPVTSTNAPAAVHTHPDESETTCTVLEVDEVQPVSYPHTTEDLTVVSDTQSWFNYLTARYTVGL